MQFRIQSNGEVVVRELDTAARRIQKPQALLEDMGEHMVNTSVPLTFRLGGRPRWPSSAWQSGQNPQRDTTQLLRSVAHEVSGSTLRVGSNLIYAAQRQLGGRIQAKRARALAIPLPGVPRTMRRPRRWGGQLFMLESDKPDTVGILASRSKSGDIVPRFVLRRAVEQPARPFVVYADDDIAWFHRRVVAALEGAE